MAVSQLTDLIRSSISADSVKGLKEATIYVAKTFFKCYYLYHLYQMALSDALCLKTYRHGTNPYAVAMITLKGPDYKRAGVDGEAKFYREAIGQESKWASRDRVRQAFYLVEDFPRECQGKSFFTHCMYYIGSKLNVKYYSILSTVTFTIGLLPLPRLIRGRLIKETSTVFKEYSYLSWLGLAFPTVKFHVDPDRSNCFIRDDDAGCGAVYVKNSTLAVSDVGYCGIIKDGINTRVFTRIKKHPGQFLWGMTQLIIAIAFTVFCFPNLAFSYRHTLERVVGGALKSVVEDQGVVDNIIKIPFKLLIGGLFVHTMIQF